MTPGRKLLALAAAFVALAVMNRDWWPPAAVLAWTAAAFAAVAAGYFGLGPGLFGKRPDGRLGRRAVLLGPYLLLNGLAFTLFRRTARGPAFAEVVPGLFLGRRLTEREARAFGPAAVLDLTCEFAEVPAFRSGRYKCVPLLDATAPTAGQLREALDFIAVSLPHDRVYVHCALGHGRSATVVAAHLLAAGAAGSVGEAVELVRAARPEAGPDADQLAAVRAVSPRTRR